MKLRERKITVRLTDAERDHLLAQAELAGLKIEPFVRNMILGVQMQPRPKEEWAELLRQTSGIANNINQITKRANGNGRNPPAHRRYAGADLGQAQIVLIWQSPKFLPSVPVLRKPSSMPPMSKRPRWTA